MSAIAEFFAVLGFQYEGGGDAQKFEGDLKHISESLGRFADRTHAIAQSVVLGLGAITAGIGASLGKGVINASAEWETYTATLETIEGSAEKAEKALDWAATFAKTTPYELSEVTQALIRLKASGLDPMDGTLAAVGDAASAMGTDLMSGVEAIADAATGEYERLKAYGVTASTEGKKVTFTWRKNGQEFTKTLVKSGAAIAKFVKENFEGRFGGSMIRQSKTWKGMLSNLGDGWDDFQRRIGAAGFFDTVKNRLGDLLDYINELDQNGTLTEWSTNLSWAFTKAADGVAAVARQIKMHVSTIGKLWSDGGWSEKIKPFTNALGLLVAAMFPVASLFAVAALAIDDWLTYMAGGDSVIGGFIDTIAKFLGSNPDKVAEVLGSIAQNAAWFATAAIGVTLFAGALRQLSGALLLLKGAGWAAKMLGGLAGIKWGTAAAGAAEAAGAGAGAAAGATGRAALAGAAFSPVAPVAAGSAALGAASMGIVGAMPDEQRKALYDSPMAGAMGGDFALGAAFMDVTNQNAERERSGVQSVAPAPPPVEPMEIDLDKLTKGMQRYYGVSKEALTNLAAQIQPALKAAFAGLEGARPGGSGLEMMAKLALDMSNFNPQMDGARAALISMDRTTYTAQIDGNTAPLMAKIAEAKRAIAELSSARAGPFGRAAVPPRAAVTASPAG